MINNQIKAAASVGLGLLVWACNDAHAVTPTPFQGVVEYDDRVIGFELGGRVQSLAVERGQDIAQDVVLAKLDDSLEAPLREMRASDLAAAEAQLRLLKAGTRVEELRAAQAESSALSSQVDILQKNLTRQQTLVEQSALAQSVVDDTSSQLSSTTERKRAQDERYKALRSGARGEEIAAAIARVQGATAALAEEDARLARYTLHAPIAGNVLDTHVKAGEMVSPGAPAISVADILHPYIDVFVPQARIHELHVGDALWARVDGVSGPLTGKIEHIFSNTEFTPRYLFSEGERENLVIRVRVRVDDSKRQLHSGVPAFVSDQEDVAATTQGAQP